MSEQKLIELIQLLKTKKQEWKTVDAKQDLILKEVGDKAAFVKDIVAMANNNEPSYLVIGLHDETFKDVGVLNHHYSKNDINQILSDKIDPPVITEYNEYQIGENEYALIEIFGSNPPYIVARDLVHKKSDRKRARVYKGTIYIRHEDRTEGISRSELEIILSKGLRWIFKNETEKARNLAFKKPDFWEYLLTGELLETRVAKISKKWNDVERGLVYKTTKKLSGKDFINWASARFNDLVSLINVFMVLLNEEFTKAWGEPGEPGNAVEILKLSDRFYSACEDLLNWEVEIRSVTPPESFEHLKNLFEGMSKELFEAVEILPKKLLEPFEQPDPSGTIVIQIVFDPPTNIEEVGKEIERLTNNPYDLIDEF